VLLGWLAWCIYSFLSAGLKGSWWAAVLGLVYLAFWGWSVFARGAMSEKQEAFDASVGGAPDYATWLKPGTAGVVIRRRPYWAGSAIRFRVWIDDEEVGLIAMGGTRLFEVEPGEHCISLRGRHSPVPPAERQWRVTLAAGEVGDFICSVGRHNAVELLPTEQR
jgi:hypothetical protein